MSVADTKGKTLPARAYTSPEVYEAEMREVFLKSWNFACHVSDVAEPGRFWTTTIAGEPIAVLRDKDGQLRALSNVCRHRAARILDGQGSCPKVLRCPYHGWTYRQDGQLAAVPEARGFEQPRPREREAAGLPGGRAERDGVRLHERGDRAARHLLRRPGREAGAACGWPSSAPARGSRMATTTTGR